jgi:hypothetical protein
VLTLAFTVQRFETIARRHPKIVEPSCVVQQTQLSQRDGLNVGRKLSAPPAFPDRCRFATAEAGDHLVI